MRRKVIAYGQYYKDFLATLTEKEIQKVKYVLSLLGTEDRLPIKFIKVIRDGLYELRISYNGNIYRIFFIFDEGQIVVLFNGFHKKTQKTPSSEIDKALKIKEEYYEYKKQHADGAPGTPEREKFDEEAYAFYTGQILLDARREAKVTQSELAKRINATKSYISRIESGAINPSVGTFYRIINALGLKIEIVKPIMGI